MSKKEITSQGTTKLANKDLRFNLTQMDSALKSAKKSAWKYAVALQKIINLELYVDDFKNIGELCKYVSISKATASQYVGAVDCMMEHNWLYNDKGEVAPLYSVGNAYLLSTLKEDFDSFFEYCNEKQICTTALSQAELKKIIKEFRNSIESEILSEETAEETAEETTKETAEETTEETTEEKEMSMLKIVKRNNKYYCRIYENNTESEHEISVHTFVEIRETVLVNQK